MRRNHKAMLLSVLTGLALLLSGVRAQAAPVAHHDFPQAPGEWKTVCLSGQVLVETQADGSAVVKCYGVEASPVPATETSTPTETPGPTQTPVPTNTDAPTLTPEPPTATVAPSTPIAPFASAPLCPSHNARAFHTLWDAKRGCHYDHQHGSDPHDQDAALGLNIYSLMGGEISYPWMTFSVADGVTYLENDVKHAGYGWHGETGMSCAGVPAPCISDFRALVHQHPSGRDATVIYHSYVFEGATTDDGYFLYSGWLEFGDLHSPEGTVIVNAPDNHDATNCTGAGRHKQHSPSGSPQIIWYGASRQLPAGECGPRGFVTLSVSTHDVWDYTSQTTPASFTDYVCYGLVPANRCTANATTLRAHLIGLNMSVDRWDDLIDPDGDGIADWEGYANRYGLLRDDDVCTAPSVDCAPVIFRNIRLGHNYEATGSRTANNYEDYDIYFDGRTSGWSQPVP